MKLGSHVMKGIGANERSRKAIIYLKFRGGNA